MSIYSTMKVFDSSPKAQAILQGMAKNPDTPLPFDLRAKYPFYKLSIGQSLAFDLSEYKENNLRSTVSQYNKRHNCQLICLKHDAVLEVARLK